MANKFYSDVTPHKQKGGEGGSNKAQGSGGPPAGREGTANWPGVPGKTQPKSRAGGASTRGKMGEFYVKKVGL